MPRADDNRFIATFEQTAVGLTHSDFDGRFLHVNRRFCRMLGYEKPEVLALPPGALTHAEDRGLQGPGEAQLLNGEAESIAQEQRYLHKDGRAIWVRVTTSLARDDNGAPSYFVGVVEDISERKQAEEHHRATVMQAPIGIMQITLQGEILQVNPKLCEITGYPREALLSMNSTAILHGGKRSQFESLGMDSLLEGEIPSFTLDKRVKRKDGARIWVRCTMSVVRDSLSQPQHLICIIEDVSERKEVEERYRATVDNAPVGIMHTALDKSTLHVNSKLCEMLGYTEQELLRLRSRDIVPPEHYGADNEQFERLNDGQIDSFASERPLICKDGRIIWVNRTVSVVRDSTGKPMYHVRVMVDVTERKYAALALVESEIKFRQLAENIPEVFWITDAAQRETLYVSAAYEKITGISGAPLLANPGAWLKRVHAEDRRRVYQSRKALPHHEYNIEYRIVRPDGAVRWIHDQAFPVLDSQQRVYRIAGIANDITRRKEAEEKLVHLAHYDPLTGLPNRVMFHDRLRQAMAQARRRNAVTGVMFIDLDRFKVANDTLGHAAGDALLKEVAERLRVCLRNGDTVARLSGDEFGLVLGDLRANEDACVVARKVLDTLQRPFNLEGHDFYVTASVGISLYPVDGDTPQDLLKNADTAMYRAKEAGRNNFQFYTTEMNTRTLQRLEMENGLRKAIERQEFLLHYQPKVDLRDGSITGFEALLRWQRPGKGLVSPAEFVPLLEDTGLIVPVGEWLIDTACAQIGAWRRAGIEPRPIAINLSARQFTDKNLAATIKRCLEVHFVESHLLELEITESSLVNNTEEAIATLKYLKSLGLHISIDDFGTGYSSLSYLKRFPLDALKVDRSFVRDITTDTDDAAITHAIISMAHSLGLKVIAEGVETEAQLTFLASHGCEQMQGYLFSKPVPAGECGEMLRTGRRLALPASTPEANNGSPTPLGKLRAAA